MSSAGIIVIGDEILKGQTQDVNTHFLARKIKDLGLELKKVSVVPDRVQEIADEVKFYSSSFDFVFTSGGIGPTHDDVTFEAIAAAFDDEIHRDPDIVDVIDKYFSSHASSSTFNGVSEEARYKLAEIPSQSKVNFARPCRISAAKLRGIDVFYPLVSIGNVYVFPGIPALLRKSFENIAVDLIAEKAVFSRNFVLEVFLADSEIVITDSLNRLVKKYKEKGVIFGSYPEWTHNYYKTKLTVESKDQEIVNKVAEEIKSEMAVVNYDPKAAENSLDKIEILLESNVRDLDFVSSVRESLGVVEKCFNDFGPDQVNISINGGKDCVTMVHLIHSYFQKNHKGKLKAVYIREMEPFVEVEEFIETMGKLYDLDLQVEDGPMKEALTKIFTPESPLKASFVGTRMGDPGSTTQSHFSMTDGDWPKLMRVNPILNWSYKTVWKFIRGLSLPYPTLYDQGYTSLGNKNNTVPNPHLKYQDPETGEARYRPAYELENPEFERAGRIKQKTK